MSSKKKPTKPCTEKPDDTRLLPWPRPARAIFPVAPSAASLPESYAATLQEINPPPRRPHPRRPRRQSRCHRRLLAHGKNHPRPPAGCRLGRQSHPSPRRRSPGRVSGHGRAHPSQPVLYEGICRSLPGRPNCETTCFTIAMGADHPPHPDGQSPCRRDFYIRETLAHGWSRSILEMQIQSQLHLRAGKAQNDFPLTMPPADSDMAAQLFKTPSPNTPRPRRPPWGGRRGNLRGSSSGRGAKYSCPPP